MRKIIVSAVMIAMCLGIAAPAMAWRTNPPAREVCRTVRVCKTVWTRGWHGPVSRVVCRRELRCRQVRYVPPRHHRPYYRDYSRNYYHGSYYGNSLATSPTLFR